MQHIFTFPCSSLLCVILLVIKHVSFVMPLKPVFLGVGWFRRVPVLEIKASHPTTHSLRCKNYAFRRVYMLWSVRDYAGGNENQQKANNQRLITEKEKLTWISHKPISLNVWGFQCFGWLTTWSKPFLWE